MAAYARGGKKSPSDMHREWLELLQREGAFLSVPVLKSVWPTGVPALTDKDKLRVVRDAFEAFVPAWDAWHADVLASGAHSVQQSFGAVRLARDKWVEAVLTELVGWGARYETSQAAGSPCAAAKAFSPDGVACCTPTGALVQGGRVLAYVLVVDPQVEALDKNYPSDGWSANAIDRMACILRGQASECSVGVVTDGRWWALVSAPKDGSCAWGMTDSLTWAEERCVRDAFARLLDVRLLDRGLNGTTLSKMFADSVSEAEEVTESLGRQVRRAVELLVAAFDESGVSRVVDPRTGSLVGPSEVYEAAVCVMMRIVFLLFAQERDLLPSGALFSMGYGLAGVLDELKARKEDEGSESMDGTSLTWHRLLATSNALFSGATFEDMRLPAYGGSVFDPARHPFLTQTDDQGALLVTVSDRVMLHVLRSVQEITVKGDPVPRRLSFKEVDVEQIGYIYEGLLGFTCEKAPRCVVGLKGKAEDEPEVALEDLEALAEKSCADPVELAKGIVDFLKKEDLLTKTAMPSAKTYEKDLKSGVTLEDQSLVLQAARDPELQARLLPFMPIIRRDLRGKPVVYGEGSLYVRATSSRKDAGAHYTPRFLAEDVVRHALEPLVYNPGPHQTSDKAKWRRIGPDEILSLKVADIACGSGAFLVAAARYLAGQLCAAWAEHGLNEELAPERRMQTATRLVVSNCLYGVDINEMAVEMCKLSLWLVSLDRTRPFSFVDNKVFVGNTLLGVTSLDQVRYLSLDGRPRTVGKSNTQALFALDDGARVFARSQNIDDIMTRARELRRSLSSDISENDPMRTLSYKGFQMEVYDGITESLERVADGLVAAGLIVGGKPSKKLNEQLDRLSLAVARAYPADSDGDRRDESKLNALLEEGLTPTVNTDYERWKCVHWPLLMPEVFDGANPGFSAVIGNPPFLGGQKLTGSMGTNVRDWFVNMLAGGAKGSADLCAYFFLRAYNLLKEGGTLGLLATNTIAQGATREVGLDRLVSEGFAISRAVRSEKWPVSSASLEYAAVWGRKGGLPDGVARVCDGKETAKISTLLEPQGRVEGKPFRLAENAGIAFQGCIVLGEGFIVEPEEAREWIEDDPRNAEVLFPYLNGENLNSRPDCSATRWIIDFNERDEGVASRYIRPFKRTEEKVKEERCKKKDPNVLNVPWWQYLRTRPAMRKAIAPFKEVLVLTLTSNTLMPRRYPSNWCFSHAVGVFASESYSFQAVLSSSMHQLWVTKWGSGMKGDVRYTPSDVFETFPLPEGSDLLVAIGRELDESRGEIMVRRDLGLTALYNLVNDPRVLSESDPDVAKMRDIHQRLDEAVMAAYGWGDVPLCHGFHEYRKMVRWTVCPEARSEILERLLELNHERYAAEPKGDK